MKLLDILQNVESMILSILMNSLTFRFITSRNFPTAENISKKIKSDEERQERGDVLETRQFGLVTIR